MRIDRSINTNIAEEPIALPTVTVPPKIKEVWLWLRKRKRNYNNLHMIGTTSYQRMERKAKRILESERWGRGTCQN